MTTDELMSDTDALVAVVQWNERVAIRATLWRDDVLRVLHDVGRGSHHLFGQEDDPREGWGRRIGTWLDERLQELEEIRRRLTSERR